MKEKELFTLTALESNLTEVIHAITRLIAERSIRIFWFSGDLGAGKTTLIRGLVRELGYSGIVGSPTYGLVNTYDLEGSEVIFKDNKVDSSNNNKLNSESNKSNLTGNPSPNNLQTEFNKKGLPGSEQGLNEPINIPKYKRVHHSDWYRIESVDELYDAGIEEELHEGSDIWLIEWAEMGLDVLDSLPVIKIEIQSSSPISERTYRFLELV